MLAPGFEWFVAWRHLRDPERRSRTTLYFGLALLAWGILTLVVVNVLPRIVHVPTRAPGEWMQTRPLAWLEYARTSGMVALILGLLLSFLGLLFANFTVFTAVSIFGVFLGTGAPVIALSVMSGFEADLKTKIRSTKADVMIERADDQPFTDWQTVDAKLAGVPGVVGSMAYVEAEVIVKHATNPAGMGIILRGIDPTRAAKVLGLERTLKEGNIAWLEQPSQIPSDELALIEPRPRFSDEPEPPKLPPAPRPVLPGILLGEELFEHTLRVFIGSDVDVACPLCGVGPAGPMPKLKPFRVAGHFYSGMYEFDSKLAYVSLRDAQKFLGTPGEVTGIEVRTETPEHARAVADEIGRRLGPTFEVRSWDEH